MITSRLSGNKRTLLPENFVRFLGFTIYNAKKYSGAPERFDLAQAHYNYVEQIPMTIKNYIKPEIRQHLTSDMLEKPIGMKEVMHSHNTLPGMAQKYKQPIWKVPSNPFLETKDRSTILGNRNSYEQTKNAYMHFAEDLLTRVERLEM